MSVFKLYEFLEFLTKFRFFGFGSNSKIAKNAKKVSLVKK